MRFSRFEPPGFDGRCCPTLREGQVALWRGLRIGRHGEGFIEPSPRITVREQIHAQQRHQVGHAPAEARAQLQVAQQQDADQCCPDLRSHGVGRGAHEGLDLQVLLERLERDAQAIERWQRESYPAIAAQAKREGADIFFWDESGFRADTVHGKTWGIRGKTPVVQRPGQRQSVSAASAVNSRGAFWFCVYQGALNAELFIELLEQMMKGRKKPVHLVLDSLPAHKKANVREYVQSTEGKLSLHFLPGYAPDLNPDELVWSHVKRTGTARRPLQAGEKLDVRIDAELHAVQRNRKLVRSFFRAPSVAYISDC